MHGIFCFLMSTLTLFSEKRTKQMPTDSTLNFWGALCFGIVIGWICYRTLRRNQAASGLSDIATVIGAVGGAAITGIWTPGTGAFGGYCIGLLAGFFLYLIFSLILEGPEGRKSVGAWLGTEPPKGQITPVVPPGGGGGLPADA
jgi:NhaP-type Na+/H+ and K+/H+ antiporter